MLLVQAMVPMEYPWKELTQEGRSLVLMECHLAGPTQGMGLVLAMVLMENPWEELTQEDRSLVLMESH